MKFHLPKTLFVAVMAAVVATSQAYAVADKYNFQDYDNVTIVNSEGAVTITVTDMKEGKTMSEFDMFSHTLDADTTADDATLIGGAASPDKPVSNDYTQNETVSSVTINLEGGTGLKYIVGIGYISSNVSGSIAINVNGGDHGSIYGGVYYPSKINATSEHGIFAPKSKDNNVTITVNGGHVNEIRGGNTNSSAKIADYIKGKETGYEERPWALGGNVKIVVNGGSVGTKKDDEAILSSGSSHSIDGNVDIEINGGEITGDIIAGGRNNYAEIGGSTSITISGGTVIGDVIAGSHIDTADYKKDNAPAPIIKKGTSVTLSGGTVEGGNIYAAGVQDIVNANDAKIGTQVTITGEGTAVTSVEEDGAEVGGNIYGGGIDSKIEGDRVLTVDESYTGDKEYKVADFTDIAVNADVTLASMSAASEGTDVKIADEATLKLTGEKTTHTATNVTGGTLYVDATTFELAEDGTLESKVVLDNHATLNLNGVEAACDIVVYGCTIAGATNFTGNLNVDGGQLTLADPTCAQNVTITNGGSITGASLATTTLTVAPTDSTTPVITSDLIIHENGTITMEGGEKLVVTGSVTLGANTRIIATGDYEHGDEILTATGGLNYEDGVTLNLGGVIAEVQGNTLVVMSLFDQPLADALSANNWALAMSSRAFVNAVRGQRTNTGCIANGRGTAWAAVLGGTQDLAGADIDLKGAAVGADMKVGEKSSVGIALGYIDGETQSPGMGKIEQEGAYVALYGEHGLKKLSSTSCLSLDWVAAYGSTESEQNDADWTQDSLQLNTRLNWNKKVTDRLCMSVFGGLEYYTNESDTVEGVKTGSVQNLRGEIGVGARYVAWGTPAVTDNKTGAMMSAGCQKLVLHGELRYMNDMVRSNPVIEMEGLRGGSDNPGRQGVGIEAGATYRIGERWSASANYGYNTMDDSREHRVNVGASYTF